MIIDTSTVWIFILGTATSIIGYFLKIVHNDVRKNTEEQGKLKGKFELLEQENRLKLQHIEENTQHEIRIMATKIGDLSDTVGELVRIQMNAATSARRRNSNNN